MMGRCPPSLALPVLNNCLEGLSQAIRQMHGRERLPRSSTPRDPSSLANGVGAGRQEPTPSRVAVIVTASAIARNANRTCSERTRGDQFESSSAASIGMLTALARGAVGTSRRIADPNLPVAALPPAQHIERFHAIPVGAILLGARNETKHGEISRKIALPLKLASLSSRIGSCLPFRRAGT